MRKEIMYRNKQERIAVLKKLGSMGYKWNGGEAVLEYDSSIHDSIGGYIVLDDEDSDKTIRYGGNYTGTSITNGIPAEKFLKKTMKHNPIVITMKDRKVTAEDKATGKTASAICGYGDDFNFKTGAAIALARLMSDDDVTADVKAEWHKLFGEDCKANDDEIKVGDRVVIKSWDEMARDYEVGKYSNFIRHNGQSFTDRMRELCGRTATVTAKNDHPYSDSIELEFDNKSGTSVWGYSEWMVKKTDAPKLDDIKAGDRVTVTDSGYGFSTYPDWFSSNNIDKDVAMRYAYNSYPKEGEHYWVKAVAPHMFSGLGDIYCIQSEKHNDGINPTYLIGRDGIEKYEG